jgi:hypothetical protein
MARTVGGTRLPERDEQLPDAPLARGYGEKAPEGSELSIRGTSITRTDYDGDEGGEYVR